MILVIDNYDSFTFNLVQVLGVLGAEVQVLRNDAATVAEIEQLRPVGIVLSPGPGRPEDAGCCIEVIRQLGERTPILGVCLGHQALGAAFGAQIVAAPEVVHGKTVDVSHEDQGLLAGLPSPFEAARYHSLVVASEGMPQELRVDATAPGGLVMAMSHRELPLYGVQFHPESIATPAGPQLLGNFLRVAGAGGTGPITLPAQPAAPPARPAGPEGSC